MFCNQAKIISTRQEIQNINGLYISKEECQNYHYIDWVLGIDVVIKVRMAKNISLHISEVMIVVAVCIQ